ncbi:MAG: pantetheine-phosphate adenylyltransferase [Candidatus Melainabacteria bacterium]|jgi:pantetheine-phosphate adenylyltransferase
MKKNTTQNANQNNNEKVVFSYLEGSIQELINQSNHKSLFELIELEKEIFRNYQNIEYKEYQKLLLQTLEKYTVSNPKVEYVIEYLKAKKPKIAVFPGTFNPFHVGHLSILHKAEKIFDKVIIAMGANREKSKNLSDELFDDLKKQLPNHQVEKYEGVLTEFINSFDYRVTVIRGLRNGSDLEYEFNLLRVLEDLNSEIDIVYIPCDRRYAHVSSSVVRQLDMLDKQIYR